MFALGHLLMRKNDSNLRLDLHDAGASDPILIFFFFFPLKPQRSELQ